MKSLAISLGESLFNNLLANEAQNQQNEYNKQIMAIQHGYNEKSAEQQMRRNLEIYNKTQSTQAKVAEMKAAGLSVGMLNGTPSQGGASGSGMASTSAIGVAPMAISPLDYANTKLAIAQAKNIDEDTRGKRIQNDVNDNYLDDITKTGLENLQKQGVSIELQNEYQEYTNEIKASTQQSEIQGILSENLSKLWQSNIDKNNAQISDETLDTQIAMTNLALFKGLADLNLTVAQTTKLEEETKYINKYYQLEFFKIQNIKDENERNRKLEKWKTEYSGALQTRLQNNIIGMQQKELNFKEKTFVKDTVFQGIKAMQDGFIGTLNAGANIINAVVPG